MNDAASPPDRPASYEDRPDRLWRLGGRIFRARWWLMLLGCAQRLRDHAFSGWWVVPMLGLMLLGFVLDEFGVLPRISAHTDLISLPVALVTLVLFGCLRGTRGPNRFGPDPVG
jgi:hypothetical protein